MDIATLRVFAAVAREGSLSRAAERLHLTQPAVSLQVKALQERLNLRLFDRTPRGMRLTPDGAALLPLADKVLEAQREFVGAAQRLHHEVRGTLRIGTILDPEFTRLGAFLRSLVESAPQVQTVLRQGMSGEVLARLEAGEQDVGFFLGDPNEERTGTPFKVRALTPFTYRVLAPAGWGPQVLGQDWRGQPAVDRNAPRLRPLSPVASGAAAHGPAGAARGPGRSGVVHAGSRPIGCGPQPGARLAGHPRGAGTRPGGG